MPKVIVLDIIGMYKFVKSSYSVQFYAYYFKWISF